MQNELVNTDESINIDELQKSKTISLTSNRSPVLDDIDQGLNSLWSHYISNLLYQKYAANMQNGIKAPCGTCWLLTKCCYLIFYRNWILFIWLGGNLKPLFWGLPQNRLFALTCFWYLHVVCASQKFCCLTIIINILLYVWNIS